VLLPPQPVISMIVAEKKNSATPINNCFECLACVLTSLLCRQSGCFVMGIHSTARP
jgi:hypothetical protein